MQHWNITTEGLKDMRHPVLSVRGSDTLPVFFAVADLLQHWIPEIDTVSIPRASHDLPGRNAAAVATGLVEFFTKNDLICQMSNKRRFDLDLSGCDDRRVN